MRNSGERQLYTRAKFSNHRLGKEHSEKRSEGIPDR